MALQIVETQRLYRQIADQLRAAIKAKEWPVGDRLPAGLLTLPKRGFAVPLADWFRGPLREFLRDHLTSASFRQRGFTEPAFVDYLNEEHQTGRRDNSARLWELLMLELWFRDWSKESNR